MDPNVGVPHGKQSMFRWDASTASVALVVGAFVFLIWVHFAFGASASVNVHKG